MRGAIPPLPQYVFMAWCLVKHRDKFTFYVYLIPKRGLITSSQELLAVLWPDHSLYKHLQTSPHSKYDSRTITGTLRAQGLVSRPSDFTRLRVPTIFGYPLPRL
jgi:hypothetical protein